MIAVIRVSAPPKSRFLRYRAKKGKIPLELLNKNILNADFLEIRVTPGCKGVNYGALAEKICCLSGRTVLSNELKPPPGCRINQYSAAEYRERLLFNFVLAVFRRSCEKIKLTVLLCDRKACCTGAAAELTAAGAAVNVATDRPDEYEKCRRHCEDRYGAAPLIFGYDTAVPKSDAAVIFTNDRLPAGVGNEILFSGAPRENAFCLLPSEGDFPEEIVRYCAGDIDPSVMAAALCEEQGIFSLLGITPEYLVMNGGKADVCGASRLLERRKAEGCR